jgi:hypothetical protein
MAMKGFRQAFEHLALLAVHLESPLRRHWPRWLRMNEVVSTTRPLRLRWLMEIKMRSLAEDKVHLGCFSPTWH